jgi:hypothetical protein
MTIDEVRNALERDTMADELREQFKGYEGSNPEMIETVIEWVLEQRDHMIQLAEDVDDPDDISMAVAIRYIELKSRWISYNTQSNYQMFRYGKVDAQVPLRGSGVSHMLAKIEPLIPQNDIDHITNFLSQPLSQAA